MKRIRYIIPLCIIPFVLASCGDNTDKIKKEEKEEEIKECNLPFRELSDSVNQYYSSIDTSKTGDEFINQLTPVISANYHRYSYDGAWEVLAKADEDPFNSENIACIYTGKSIAKNVDTNSKAWNREHVWAKSHGFPKPGYDAYSDCHHLTASYSAINSTRSDLDFGEVSNYEGEIKSDVYGNKWITDLVFEPRDEVKGDIARKLFYMVARYNSDALDLTLVDEIPSGQTEGNGHLGSISTLLKWHYQDPVDDAEIKRNEVIYSYQNNRNPFIDHPEWVSLAFPNDLTKVNVDEASVSNIIARIEELPNLVTLNDKNTIDALYQAVMKLNYREKLYVTNYSSLTNKKRTTDYLANIPLGSDADIKIDFNGTVKKTDGYLLNQSWEIDSHSFMVSSAIGDTGGIFRMGVNDVDKRISLDTIGLTDKKGAYMVSDFSSTNLHRIILQLGDTAKNTTIYIIKCVDGVYTLLKETEAMDNATIDASFDAFDGQFLIAVSGESKPRIIIEEIYLYNK